MSSDMPEIPGIAPAVIHAMQDGIKLLTEMMAGYRKSLMDAGFPQHVADQMAVQFHAKMLEQMK